MSNSLPPFVDHQAPLSMGFPWQEYWNGLPFPPTGDIPDPGIKPASPVSPSLQADFLSTEPHWELHHSSLAQTHVSSCSSHFFLWGFLKTFPVSLKMTTYTFRLEYALKLQPTCCPRTFFFFKKQEPSLLDAEFLKVRDHVLFLFLVLIGLPWCLRQLRICLQCRRPRFSPWVGKILWSREW